jgi:trehalose 6-phosphate phosphatase
MTKHGVVLGPEDAVVAAAAARHFSFPPPRTGADSCKKLAAQVDLGAAAVMGSWLDSMKASSPRHRLMAPLPGAAADAEHDDWMVSGYTPARPPAAYFSRCSRFRLAATSMALGGFEKD